jgi:hypothetical protein
MSSTSGPAAPAPEGETNAVLEKLTAAAEGGDGDRNGATAGAGVEAKEKEAEEAGAGAAAERTPSDSWDSADDVSDIAAAHSEVPLELNLGADGEEELSLETPKNRESNAEWLKKQGLFHATDYDETMSEELPALSDKLDFDEARDEWNHAALTDGDGRALSSGWGVGSASIIRRKESGDSAEVSRPWLSRMTSLKMHGAAASVIEPLGVGISLWFRVLKALGQGLTLVNVRAELEHNLDKSWVKLGTWGTKTTQVELKVNECKPLPRGGTSS